FKLLPSPASRGVSHVGRKKNRKSSELAGPQVLHQRNGEQIRLRLPDGGRRAVQLEIKSRVGSCFADFRNQQLKLIERLLSLVVTRISPLPTQEVSELHLMDRFELLELLYGVAVMRDAVLPRRPFGSE